MSKVAVADKSAKMKKAIEYVLYMMSGDNLVSPHSLSPDNDDETLRDYLERVIA